MPPVFLPLNRPVFVWSQAECDPDQGSAFGAGHQSAADHVTGWSLDISVPNTEGTCKALDINVGRGAFPTLALPSSGSIKWIIKRA